MSKSLKINDVFDWILEEFTVALGLRENAPPVPTNKDDECGNDIKVGDHSRVFVYCSDYKPSDINL